MKPLDHRSHNRRAWNQLAKSGNRFARPAKEKDFIKPLASVDGPGWLGGDITGKELLCLAAGGGRQGPIYATAGARVTVVDISDEMLRIDRAVAQNLGLSLRTVETSMEDLSMFEDAMFDIIIHPVSTCYVPDVAVVFNEVGRVLKTGGLYISQHKQPASLQSSITPEGKAYLWQHSVQCVGPLPAVAETNLVREPGTLEFVHSLEQLMGTMCRAGFAIEDVIEPNHANKNSIAGSFEHRSIFIPPYLRILARRNSKPAHSKKTVFWS